MTRNRLHLAAIVLAETVFNHAGRCMSIHHGTFDGWCWGHVHGVAAWLGDLLDPIPPKGNTGCRGRRP